MSDEMRAVRMADLPDVYQAPQEGGQGESLGSSFLSWAGDLPVIIGEVISGRDYTSERLNTWRWAQAGMPNPGSDRYNYLFRTETTRERGEQMRFSRQPDPLTEAEKVGLNTFYEKVLKDGFAQWPLDKDKVTLYIDGIHRKIYSNNEWGSGSEYIYIGYGKDKGDGNFSQPAVRLACVTTLMGITGHSGKPNLIALLGERLAKVMVGVYDSVVKPLAVVADAKPIRRMAWSASGGLASWCDGEWVGLTGEPVAVGADWIVIDTEEGPIEEGLPSVQAGSVVVPQVVRRTFEEMCVANGYSTGTMESGRKMIHWSRAFVEEARRNFVARLEDGDQVEWVEEGVWVGFAAVVPSLDDEVYPL